MGEYLGFTFLTTSINHNLNVGDKVKVSNFAYQNHNGTFEVTQIITPTVFVTCKSYVANEPVSFVNEIINKVEFVSDGLLRAIEIKNSSVKLKTRLLDKLITYKIDFEYSNKNTVQK